MTAKLFSITLLAALTTAATAQTTTTKPSAAATKPSATATKPATTTHRTTSTATTTTPPNVPKVVGIPKTAYALRYVDTLVGTGPLAEPSIIGTSMADSKIKWYTVKYTGWLTNGTKFDSSYDHPGGEPIIFIAGAHRVITGWDTGFQGMHVGGKRRLFIPYQLAYGEAGKPPQIPPKSDLIFDIELVSISDKPPTPPTPPQPAAKPADPNAKPAEPAAKPTDPNAKPADPNAKPTDPNAKPATTPPPADPTKPETTPHPQSL
jgi:peptidylprolyl isomerase